MNKENRRPCRVRRPTEGRNVSLGRVGGNDQEELQPRAPELETWRRGRSE